MLRWNGATKERESLPAIDAYLAELVEVSKRHGLTLGHEDAHGSFIVYGSGPAKEDVDWLTAAAYYPKKSDY